MLESTGKRISLVILDRDGVINKKANLVTGGKYILKVEDLEIYPDFFEFAQWAESVDIVLVVATNQQGLALNLLTSDSLDAVHEEIQKVLRQRGIRAIRNFYICGHLVGTCACRKPAPGLLLRILSDFELSAAEVIVVGDSNSDQLAANAAKINFIQIKRDNDEADFAEIRIIRLTELIGAVG
jgi:D-glycero-D-manno-heptose 1,7-bisphosphate phosphatase